MCDMGTIITSSQQIQFPWRVYLLDSCYLHPINHLRIIVSNILLRWHPPSFTSHNRDRDPYYARSDTAYRQLPRLQRSSPQRYQRTPSSTVITESPREAGAKPALYMA